MALDIGQVRCGIAICDPRGSVASPLTVLPTKDLMENSQEFKKLLEDWEPELFLCGMPYSLNGKPGSQAQDVVSVATTISKNTGIDCEFFDERLSSNQAKRILREKGMSEKDMRGKVDMIAASIFLQTWLDSRKDK